MSSSVLVTGGAGFIGSHLVDRLLSSGERVTVIDNFNDFYDPKIKRRNISDHINTDNYHLIEGDIRDTELIDDIFARGAFDEVFHLAAMAGVRPSLENPHLYLDVNLNGSMNILEGMRKYSVKKLFWASSSSVYGNNKKVPFAEDDPVDMPVSPYAATKKAGEVLAYTYHHLYGIKTACFRFFTVYGPRQRPEMAIHRFTDAIYNGNEITIFGDGTSERDYTYIDDIISGLIACRLVDFEYEIINLGRSDSICLVDLVTMIEGCLGKKAEIIKKPNQPGDVRRTIADINKAARLFGYKPITSIKDGLMRFIKWYLDNKAC